MEVPAMIGSSETPVIAVVQARMGSQRCPGKVMRTIAGTPLIGYLIASVQQCSLLSDVVVATSDERADDAVAEYCAEHSVTCFRGPQHDVARRFALLARQLNPWGMVRLSGDSPLLDHRLVDCAVRQLQRGDSGIVTNVRPRTFPAGQSVEAVRTSVFLRWEASISEKSDREHVFPYFYRQSLGIRTTNFVSSRDLSHLQMTVDVPHQFEMASWVISQMDRPHWQYSLDERIALWRQAETGLLPSLLGKAV